MKRFFSMLAIVGFIAVSNCSRIPENNDPVLGIWVKADFTQEEASRADQPAVSEEWIFNDVYLGRYQRYSGKEVVFYTDFRWEVSNNMYTIFYGEDDLPEVQVSLKESPGEDRLEFGNGVVFARRK